MAFGYPMGGSLYGSLGGMPQQQGGPQPGGGFIGPGGNRFNDEATWRNWHNQTQGGNLVGPGGANQFNDGRWLSPPSGLWMGIPNSGWNPGGQQPGSPPLRPVIPPPSPPRNYPGTPNYPGGSPGDDIRIEIPKIPGLPGNGGAPPVGGAPPIGRAPSPPALGPPPTTGPSPSVTPTPKVQGATQPASPGMSAFGGGYGGGAGAVRGPSGVGSQYRMGQTGGGPGRTRWTYGLPT